MDPSNGSVLCDRWLRHQRCSRKECPLEHRKATPGEPRPLCQKHTRRGGCPDETCGFFHPPPEVTDSAIISQNPPNNLSPESVVEAKMNIKSIPESSSRPNLHAAQPPRTGVPLRTGNDNRTNSRITRAPSSGGVPQTRNCGEQRKNATTTGRFRDDEREFSKARGLPDMHNTDLRDGGVPLGVPVSNGYDSPSHQVGRTTGIHGTQNGHHANQFFTAHGMNKSNGTGNGMGNVQHAPIAPYRETTQARVNNDYRNRPPFIPDQAMGDEAAMNHALNSGGDALFNTNHNKMSYQARNEPISRFPNGVRDSPNSQERVMTHDSRRPAMTGRQFEGRDDMGGSWNVRGSDNKSYFNTEDLRMHERGGYQTQENSNFAAPVNVGHPGRFNGNCNRKTLGPNATNSLSIHGPSWDRSSELKGGGVALNNHPRTGDTTNNKNGPTFIEAPRAPVTSIAGGNEGGTNGNGHIPARVQENGSLRPSPLMPKSPRGSSKGETNIQDVFVGMMRRSGKRLDPRSPEFPRPKSMEGSNGITAENYAGNPNFGPPNHAKDRAGLSGNGESKGNLPTTDQQTATIESTKTALEKWKSPRFGEIEDTDGGAKIGNTRHGECNECGAEFLGGQIIQLGPSFSQTNAGTTEYNQPVTNGVENPISPPKGPKKWVELYGLEVHRNPQIHLAPVNYNQLGDAPNPREDAHLSRTPGLEITSSEPELGPQPESEAENPQPQDNFREIYGPGKGGVTIAHIRSGGKAPSGNVFWENQIKDQHQTNFQSGFAFVNQGADYVDPYSGYYVDPWYRAPPMLPSPIKNERIQPERQNILSPVVRLHNPPYKSEPTLLSYGSSESSCSHGSQLYEESLGDMEGLLYNEGHGPKRPYTPDPDDDKGPTVIEDPNARRDYYDKQRVKARDAQGKDICAIWEIGPISTKLKSVNRGNSGKNDVRTNESILKDEKIALAIGLQVPGQFPNKPEEPSKGTQPTTPNQAPLKKLEPALVILHSSEKSPLPISRGPAVEKIEPVVVVPPPPEKSPLQISEGPVLKKSRPVRGESLGKKKLPPVSEPQKKAPPPMAEKSFEMKPSSAWGKPLGKTTPLKSVQEACWLCKRCHQRDEDCNADRKTVERMKPKNKELSGDWGYQGGGTSGWSDDDTTGVALSEPKKHTTTKGRNSLGHDCGDVNTWIEGEHAKPAPKKRSPRKKKGRSPRESNLNGRDEQKEPASQEGPAESPKADGPKSILFKADGNHFGWYYNTEATGIRKLPEDTLHMIFSYVADGLMPEDQMKMKNVHIGSNFRLDATFTITRYRRLKSVVRSCRYWRNLSQQILYKYVNLDQFSSFKRFVRTISEDAELGGMVRAVKINIQGGASYTTHENRPSRQDLSELPKASDSALLFTSMMESCPELQILSVNLHGAIRGFNFVLTKFPKMREMQIMDDSSKGMVANNFWKNLENYPNLEKFKIFHSEENGSTNFETLKISPKNFFGGGSTELALKALTMERAPELSDKILGVFATRLRQLAHLVVVDCKLVTSGGLARAIQRMPNPSQLHRLIYYVWVDPFGKATLEEMAPPKDHLCSTIRDCCTGLTYLNWKPYRICGNFWKESNFSLLKRCRIEPMVFRDCSKDIELRDHSKFMGAYKQAREEGRLPELAEDRTVFDFYF